MQTKSAYLQALRTAIESISPKGAIYYLNQINKTNENILNLKFEDGCNIIGVLLNQYVNNKKKSTNILELFLTNTPHWLWVKPCQADGKFPYDIAIINNDVGLYNKIIKKTGGYYTHDEYDNSNDCCEHLSSIEHLMLDCVNKETFDALIDEILEAYEECHSYDTGYYRPEKSLLLHLLPSENPQKSKNHRELRLHKYRTIIEAESARDCDKVELLLHPWSPKMNKHLSNREDILSDEYFSVHNNPISAAIASGCHKIVEDLFSSISTKKYLVCEHDINGYLLVALTHTNKSSLKIINLLLNYQTKFSLNLISIYSELALKKKLSHKEDEVNTTSDDILLLLLTTYKKQNPENFRNPLLSLKTQQPVSINTNYGQLTIECSLIAVLTLLGHTKTIRFFAELCQFDNHEMDDEIDLICSPVAIESIHGHTKTNLLSLALLTNNLAIIQSIIRTQSKAQELNSQVFTITKQIIEAKKMPALTKLLEIVSEIKSSTSIDSILLRHILYYIFNENESVSEEYISQLCKQVDQSQMIFSPARGQAYFIKHNAKGIEELRKPWPLGTFYLQKLHQARSLALSLKETTKFGFQICHTLFCVDKTIISFNDHNHFNQHHQATCDQLNLSAPEAVYFFEIFKTVYLGNSIDSSMDQPAKSAISNLLIEFGLYYLLNAKSNFSLENKKDFISLYTKIIKAQPIITQFDVILSNRLRLSLGLSPRSVNQTLCTNNNQTNPFELHNKDAHQPYYIPYYNHYMHAIIAKDTELNQVGHYSYVYPYFMRLPTYDYQSQDTNYLYHTSSKYQSNCQNTSSDFYRLILRMITTLTYHAVNSKSASLNILIDSNYKCELIVKTLKRLDPRFESYTDISEYSNEQYRLEKDVVKDYVCEDPSEDSDDAIDDKPLNVFESRIFEDIVSVARPDQLTDKDNKLKTVLKYDNDGQPKHHKNGGLDYNKSKFKHEPHKRARTIGETTLSSYPSEKFKKAKGESSDIEYFVREEIQRINSQYNKGQADYYTKVSTPFFMHFSRGIHYNRVDWNADDRRRHRKTNEEQTSPAHFANAVFAQHDLPLSQGATAATRQQVSQFERTAGVIFNNLQQCRASATESDFYHALHNLYSSDYDQFKALLQNCLKHEDQLKDQDQFIVQAIKQYFLNDSNHYLSTAGTPYHALKYAYGLKTYPGHQDERLRPRWRIDGRCERPYSGKAYIYLLTLEQYAKLNPYDIPSEYDKGNSAVVSVYRAERETSFMGSIPKGCILIEHIAKYPSFEHDYKPKYFSKYGLTKELYTLFRAAIRGSTPHTPERMNAKTLLGEWLCAFHEVRLLKEVCTRVINLGGVILYHNMNGFSEHLPKVIDSNKEHKIDIRNTDTEQQQTISAWRKKIIGVSKVKPAIPQTVLFQQPRAKKKQKQDPPQIMTQHN